MFSWTDLLPFAEGEVCALAARKAMLRLDGTATIRRLRPRKLFFVAEIPRQRLVVPRTRIAYRYALDPDRTTGTVEIRWNDRTYRDEAARFRPADDGASIAVDMLFDPDRDERLSYRMRRTAADGLAIDEIRGPAITAGARIEVVRRAAP
jgi:hypothetical protein